MSRIRSLTDRSTRRFSQTHGSSLVSRSRRSSTSMPSAGASRAAALSGSSTDGGVAKTDCSSTEVASSTPLASVISPRSAGICSCWASWFMAMPTSWLAFDDLPPGQPRADPGGDDGRHQEQEQGAGTAVGPGEQWRSPDSARAGRSHRFSCGLLVDGWAKETALGGRGTRPSVLLARFSITAGDRASPICEDQLLLLGPQLGELRAEDRRSGSRSRPRGWTGSGGRAPGRPRRRSR